MNARNGRVWKDQVCLMQYRYLSPSSVNVATGALRFHYKVALKLCWAVDDIPMPKRQFQLRVNLSREEVMHFLDSLQTLTTCHRPEMGTGRPWRIIVRPP